jgi:hypothetical protein
MTNEPEISEIQMRIMEMLMIQTREAEFNPSASGGLSDERLAEQLGISVDKIQEAIEELVDRGLIDTCTEPAREPNRNIENPWPSPMPPCRRCGKPDDGLDHLCTRCRAIWAWDQLVNDLTNALENFLDNRWAPHEYGRPRPAHYHTKPNFDGDHKQHLEQITTVHAQLASAASRLVKLAMPLELRAKAETAYKPFWWGADDSSDEFDGIHAAIEWGYAKVSSTQPIECNRLAVGHLKDMVERREVLIPGETPRSDELAQPGEPQGRPWTRLTPDGAQALIEFDSDAEDD